MLYSHKCSIYFSNDASCMFLSSDQYNNAVFSLSALQSILFDKSLLSNMETNQQCSIGILFESQCHQTTYSKTVGMEPFDNLPCEDREILMWRTGLSIINSNPTTCLHHRYVYLKCYASKQTRYCNPFEIHSHKKVKKGNSYCQVLTELQASRAANNFSKPVRHDVRKK